MAPIHFFRLIVILSTFLALNSVSGSDGNPAILFLRYVYGDSSVDPKKFCQPHPDIWMVPGSENREMLEAINRLKTNTFSTEGISMGVLGRGHYVFEMKNGRVDPTFYIEEIYNVQKKLILTFLYASLRRDEALLKRLSTDYSKIEISGKRASISDMGVYGEFLNMLPIVRFSSANLDAQSRTIKYRVPLTEKGLLLTLLKSGTTWKIDTSEGTRVDLDFFFRENPNGRPTQYAP